jgi:F420-0:gamma-glutamyl ligase-like protein
VLDVIHHKEFLIIMCGLKYSLCSHNDAKCDDINVSLLYKMLITITGCAIAQAISRRLPTAAARFEPRSGHVGFMLDKVALVQVFSEYFSFHCQFSFHRLPHTHHHLSSAAGTIGQTVADVPRGLSLTPPHPTPRN